MSLPRLGVTGSAAEVWPTDHGSPAPARTYEWLRADDGGLVIRVDHHEFLAEDGLDGGSVGRLTTNLGFGIDGACRVERREASLLITGHPALELFAQTCGVEVAEMGKEFFKTRIALTSCSVRRDDVGEVPGYRLWVEPSCCHYLRQARHEIVAELGGGPVGWECLERAM